MLRSHYSLTNVPIPLHQFVPSVPILNDGEKEGKMKDPLYLLDLKQCMFINYLLYYRLDSEEQDSIQFTKAYLVSRQMLPT